MSTPNQQDNIHKYEENEIKQYSKQGRNETHSDLTWKATPRARCVRLPLIRKWPLFNSGDVADLSTCHHFSKFPIPQITCLLFSNSRAFSKEPGDLQSSVSLTSSETHLQKLAKPVKLRLFSSSTSSFYLHFKVENPFFFVQTSSSSLSKKKYCVFLPLQTSPQCSILLFYSSSYIPPVSTLLHSKTNFWISSRNPPTSHSGWLFSTFPPKLFNSPKNSTCLLPPRSLFHFPTKNSFFST